MLIPTAEPFFFPGNQTGCLLVHGFTGTPKEMRLLGEHLASTGYTVLGVRLFAHATKPEDMLRARWQDWLAGVEDGWHLLRGITEKIFVIGLSMGGALSLVFASRFPVAGVIAMATPHHLPNDPRVPCIRLISMVKKYIPKDPPRWSDMEAYREHISYQVEPTRALIEVRDLLKEMRVALPKVTAPTLLIYSKNDPTITPDEKHMEMISAGLGSRIKQTLWIEQSGHVLTRDRQRQTVFEAVNHFIKEIDRL